ncbi:MAG: hypothetical protein ABJD11_10740 [Gemmatimonadota bacterium]
MDATKRDWLKERHRFTEWMGTPDASSNRPLRKVALDAADLPGWSLDRVKRDSLTGGVERNSSFWRREGGGVAVRIDLYECASSAAAREYLIDALGEFESGGMARRTDGLFGEVSFGDDRVALFIRANVVAAVRNIERAVVPVSPVAQAVDAAIVRQQLRGAE